MSAPYSTEVPTALEYFAALVADDASLALTEAAISIAQDEHPLLDTESVLAELDRLTAKLARAIPADTDAVQKLRLLNRHFFQQCGFAGNVNDFYASANSYIHEVLRTRRGIPISLAVVYLEMAQQIGLTACAVSFPGHFLMKVKMPRGEVVIDPMNGHSLSRDELDERLVPYKRRQGLLGDFDMPLGLFLQPAAPREVIARMLRNLKEIHRAAEDWPRLLAVQERLVCLLPGECEERRDRGLVRAELSLFVEAADDLDAYLVQHPRADDRHAIARRSAQLRALGRPRLH